MATVLTTSYAMETSPMFHPALRDVKLLNDLPCLPLDQPLPSGILSRRRHAISSSCDATSPYRSKPRMKRRGAVSYEKSDASALYIRYIAEALAHREFFNRDTTSLREPSPSEVRAHERRKGQNGSDSPYSSRSLKVQEKTPSTSLLDCINLENGLAYQAILASVDSWDFDIFAFSRVTEERPLFHIGLNILQKHNILEQFNLDVMRVYQFLTAVESRYHKENAYHNSIHAADVTQAVDCLISDSTIYSSLSPTEVFACLLAAMVHDLDHPGVNQNYLINTSNPLARMHGDNVDSLLEKHHCQTAKSILSDTKLLDHLAESDKAEIIHLIEDFILSTDFGKHKHFMGQFEEMAASDHHLDLSNQPERHFILMMAIKAADISNPTRPLHLSKRWSEKIMEEFFLQGDLERKLNLPISFLCDRETITIPKAQSDFFGFVALPLFKTWSQLFKSPLSTQMCRNIQVNKKYWDDILESTSATQHADS